MRKTGILFAVWFLAACAAPQQPITPMGDEPTLALLGQDGVICAAVALTPTLAVTANHCAPEDSVSFVTATRMGKADRTGLGVVIVRDVRSDLAVFAGSGFVPARVAEGRIDYEHATTLVTHVPTPWTIAEVRARDAHEGFLRTQRLDTGMSGSGLWDDGGQLVGVAVGNDATSGYFAGTELITDLVRLAPGRPVLLPPQPNAALWGDPNLSLEEVLVASKRRRTHIEAGLERLESSDAR
jgi:hypothetical protein